MSSWRSALTALTAAWPGRLLLGGAAVKLVALLIRLALGRMPDVVDVFDTAASIAVIVAVGVFAYQLIVRAKRRLLWRVRRKLILSYIFIGVVPVLLVVVFFVVTGLLLFFNVAAYLVVDGVRDLTENAASAAQAVVDEIEQAGGLREAAPILERREVILAERYPGASMALVPTGVPPCGAPVPPPGEAASAGQAGAARQASPADPAGQAAPPRGVPDEGTRKTEPFAPIVAGLWTHLSPPAVLPSWVSCSGFSGNVAYRVPRRAPAANQALAENRLVVRAAALPRGGAPRFSVIVDVPLNDHQKDRLREATSVKLNEVSLKGDMGLGASQDDPRMRWFAVLEATDWETGSVMEATQGVSLSVAELYERLSGAQAGRIRGTPLGLALLAALLFIAALFLVIEVIALGMGLMLGKSITGSVHELFGGTERVRRGDFSHRIRVQTRDQLGELADSFNSMTASIEDLLREAAEKKRLEEELRIAREIQMSLLPHGPLSVPGFSVSALCLPAREVGGDYYDLLPIDDHRVGVLIADVSGKGTSAALYMAELKGLMLSLTKIHPSPRQLLIHANRIISENLDSRSFITMTYAVIDTSAQTMTYARAGHTPLIYRPEQPGRSDVQILAPDGLVLGLQIDEGRLFEQLLQEETLPLQSGDLFLFFTDGISEAMNADSDCFGEARLGQLVAEHGHLPPEELRERILREVEAFVGTAPQHDDMTLILMKVQGTAAARTTEGELAVVA